MIAPNFATQRAGSWRFSITDVSNTSLPASPPNNLFRIRDVSELDVKAPRGLEWDAFFSGFGCKQSLTRL